jgi:hypothetical protein
VNDLLIDGGTQRFGEIPISLESGLCAILKGSLFSALIEFARQHSGSTEVAQILQYFSHDAASIAHDVYLALRFKCDHCFFLNLARL